MKKIILNDLQIEDIPCKGKIKCFLQRENISKSDKDVILSFKLSSLFAK